MHLSIFSDELALDVREALPIIKSWGVDWVDFRSRVFGKAIEALTDLELAELRALVDSHGMKVGCIQSSLAKVHLPDAERQQREAEKLEGIIRAADALDCRLVRSFFYWQPPKELQGELAIRPDELQKVLDMFAPLARRAREAGLLLTFENCGTTPDEVLTVVGALGVPAWGLAWDVANGWDCDERRKDEDAYIRRMAQGARLVHVKARGTVPGLTEETIPYDKVLQTCDNAGIRGPVSAETHNPDRSVSNADMSKQVIDVLKQAWPSAAPGSLFGETKEATDVRRPWQDDPVRFAVVGLGMGHGRSKQIANTPGCKLVTVCDLREERAKRTAEVCGVPYTTDVRDVLANDDVEVVFVLTETGRHGEIAMQALEAGKHAMTTKPMDATLAACDDMIRLAESKGLLLAVDFDRRNRSDVHTLKAAVADGAFGRLLSGTCSLNILRTMDYFHSNGGWRGTRRWDGGGVLSNQSIHHIDELAFTVGVPSKVRCSIWTQSHDIEAEDLGVATWLYDNGFVLNFTATTNYPHATWYYRCELVGTDGIFAQFAGGPFEKPMTRWFRDGVWTESADKIVKPEWLNSMDNFAAALRTGAALSCPGRDGRRTQSILDAMYRSAYDADGDWVDVALELE